MYCAIAGHRDAGMEAELTVTEGGATPTTGGGGSTGGEMDYEAMTADMIASMAKFPAATEGTGNSNLEPTEILADGTKVFDLVAEITKWERAPGDVVDAWTYNGTVPAPSIHLQVGDKAQFRLTNKLPIATDLHLHGLNVDNQFDGVAPITQDLDRSQATPSPTSTRRTRCPWPCTTRTSTRSSACRTACSAPSSWARWPSPAVARWAARPIPADVQISQEIPMVLNDSGVIGLSLNGKSFPATGPIVGQGGRLGADPLLQRGHAWSTRCTCTSSTRSWWPRTASHSTTRTSADIINVAPGERYTVLVQLDKPGDLGLALPHPPPRRERGRACSAW